MVRLNDLLKVVSNLNNSMILSQLGFKRDGEAVNTQDFFLSPAAQECVCVVPII